MKCLWSKSWRSNVWGKNKNIIKYVCISLLLLTLRAVSRHTSRGKCKHENLGKLCILSPNFFHCLRDLSGTNFSRFCSLCSYLLFTHWFLMQSIFHVFSAFFVEKIKQENQWRNKQTNNKKLSLVIFRPLINGEVKEARESRKVETKETSMFTTFLFDEPSLSIVNDTIYDLFIDKRKNSLFGLVLLNFCWPIVIDILLISVEAFENRKRKS